MPAQLMNKDFYFCFWSEALEAKNGQYAMLNNEEMLYRYDEAKLAAHFRNNKGKCGITMNHGNLISVVVHDIIYYHKIKKTLGETFRIFDKNPKYITLIYLVRDCRLPTMTFIKRLNSAQATDFSRLITEKGRKAALQSRYFKPVISLIGRDHCVGFDASFNVKGRIKEIPAESLLYILETLAMPLPLAKAYYIEGQSSVTHNDG